MKSDYAVASDGHEFITNRLNCASRLSKDDASRLKNLLMKGLPGEWDLSTLNSIQILGVVGNEETIQLLEKLDQMPTESTGKFHQAIIRSVTLIHEREDAAK